MSKTQRELIKYLENYHESRCSDLAEAGRQKDAQSIYFEIVVKGEEPKDYLFVSLHRAR